MMNTSHEAGKDPDSDEFDITLPHVAFEPLRFNLNLAAPTHSNVPRGGSSSYRAPYKKGSGLQPGGYLDEDVTISPGNVPSKPGNIPSKPGNVPSKPGNVPSKPRGSSSKPSGGSGLQPGGYLDVTISPDEPPQKKQKQKTEVPSFGKALAAASSLKRRQRPSSIGSKSIFNAFPPSTGATLQPLETVSTSGKSTSKSQPSQTSLKLQQDELQTLVRKLNKVESTH